MVASGVMRGERRKQDYAADVVIQRMSHSDRHFTNIDLMDPESGENQRRYLFVAWVI